jgi:hypothetical protein
MKKLFWILVAALSLAACSPQVYPLHLEVRQPSASGLTLVGKTASIVYMDGSNTVDSLFDRHAASALARALEADYFGGEEVIGLSRVPTQDSIGVDLMHTLVMETGGDVIFLLSSKLSPIPETDSADVPMESTLYVYDSMGEDAVKRYHGSAVLKDCSAEQLDGQAEEVGTRISRRFLSNWTTESYSFYYFDDFSSESWFTPLQDAADGQFAKAIQGWEPLVKDGTNIKRACACFNMAQAFYLLGDYVISSRWLDEADKLENLTQVPALRKRLASHLEK